MAGESDLRWTSPKTQSQIQRSKYLRDAITQMGQQSQNAFNTAEGTNYSILANAIMGYKANQAENRADRMVKSDNDRLTAAILGTPQTEAAADLGQAKPFDLTPGGFDARAQGADANRLKAIAEMGGPMAALQYQQGQEAQKYARGRDARGDFVVDRNFDFTKDRAGREDFVDDRNFGFQQGRADRQDYVDDRSFETGVDQFGQQMDFNRDQFGESQRHNRALEGLSAAELQAKKDAADAAASGGAVFDGPQLATIYNKNMGYLDEVTAAQKDLDFIAGQAQQFVDAAKDGGYWAQGEGPVNDIAQALSMDTTKLKAITDSIAPLMRRPGSGASSDTDVKMFKSAVTNINNTPEANKRFAQGAQAMAERNREYGNFLNDTIDPRDPQSRQKAQKLWNMYAAEAPIFDQKTGEVMTPVPFKDWLAMQMGEFEAPDNFLARQGAAMANMAQPAPAQDGSDLVSKWLNK